MKKIVLSMALIVSAFCATANDAIKNSSPLELQPNMVISTEDNR